MDGFVSELIKQGSRDESKSRLKYREIKRRKDLVLRGWVYGVGEEDEEYKCERMHREN